MYSRVCQEVRKTPRIFGYKFICVLISQLIHNLFSMQGQLSRCSWMDTIEQPRDDVLVPESFVKHQLCVFLREIWTYIVDNQPDLEPLWLRYSKHLFSIFHPEIYKSLLLEVLQYLKLGQISDSSKFSLPKMILFSNFCMQCQEKQIAAENYTVPIELNIHNIVQI